MADDDVTPQPDDPSTNWLLGLHKQLSEAESRLHGRLDNQDQLLQFVRTDIHTLEKRITNVSEKQESLRDIVNDQMHDFARILDTKATHDELLLLVKKEDLPHVVAWRWLKTALKASKSAQGAAVLFISALAYVLGDLLSISLPWP